MGDLWLFLKLLVISLLTRSPWAMVTSSFHVWYVWKEDNSSHNASSTFSSTAYISAVRQRCLVHLRRCVHHYKVACCQAFKLIVTLYFTPEEGCRRERVCLDWLIKPQRQPCWLRASESCSRQVAFPYARSREKGCECGFAPSPPCTSTKSIAGKLAWLPSN